MVVLIQTPADCLSLVLVNLSSRVREQRAPFLLMILILVK